MALLLIDWLLSKGWHVPSAFTYTSTRMILACLTALVFCLFLGSRFIKKLYALKIGQPISLRGDAVLLAELHQGKKNTPTMGGILMIVALIVSLLLWMDLKSPFTLLLFLTTVVLACLGGLDDLRKLRSKSSKGLSGKKKLLVQVLWALAVVAYLQIPSVATSLQHNSWYEPPIVKDFSTSHDPTSITMTQFSQNLYVPFFKEPLFVFASFSLIALWAFFVFVIVGASNAVNLTDGLDGLATGAVALASIPLAVCGFLANNLELAAYLNIPYIAGSGEIAIFLAALVGSCLGFLWYNCHPAEVFMGDIGSLTLGGILGVSSILLGREFFLGLVGAIFVVEALSVIIQVTFFKLCNKKRVFLCAPLHHHFEYKGLNETKVVIRFWIIGVILSMMGLISIKLQ